MGKIEVIEKFWQLFGEKKYFETRELFHDDCKVYMKSSREAFETVDIWLQMNNDYPGDWRTSLKRCNLVDEEAVSLAHVTSDDEDGEVYVTTFYKFKDGLISEINEYWSAVEGQPEWRKKYSKAY